MKFIIGVDLEGIACVVGAPGGSLNESRNLEFAKLQGTREADAAARALFDCGATRVIVWDNHGGSLNLHYDLLDKRCDIALGANFRRMPGLDSSFTGVLFIGYHAMDNAQEATIAHTFSSASFQWMKINGREVGEMAIDAAVAGAMGVPPIFVASDDKGVSEAQRFFPGIETVTTKQSLSWNGAISKHPARACDDIYAGVKRAVSRRNEMKPFTLAMPAELEIRHKRMETADAMVRNTNGWDRVDAYTVKKKIQSLHDYF
jgi:D-amino peptidase